MSPLTHVNHQLFTQKPFTVGGADYLEGQSTGFKGRIISDTLQLQEIGFLLHHL